jgi:hypothetical protein
MDHLLSHASPLVRDLILCTMVGSILLTDHWSFLSSSGPGIQSTQSSVLGPIESTNRTGIGAIVSATLVAEIGDWKQSARAAALPPGLG